MSQELTTVNASLPAVFQTAQAASDEFTGGVVAGFPVISYRGKVWRVKKSGEEQMYLDKDGEVMPSIEVVMLKANPTLGKIYYKGSYTEGDNSSPTCWSADGVKPDVGVTEKQSDICANCPRNIWGSRITEGGKKARECSDHRRMAVAFRHEIEDNPEPTVLLLRVPPASLNPLKDYIEKMLAPKNVPPFAVFTKIGFDAASSHPQLTFKGTQFLNEEQGVKVMKLRDSDETARILSEAKEYSAAGSTEGSEAGAPATAGQPEAPSAPAASKPKKAPKLQPAELEEAQATVVEAEPEIAAAPPPVEEEIAAPAASNGAAAPAPAAAAAPEPTVPADGEASSKDGSFDDMLDSLLDD